MDTQRRTLVFSTLSGAAIVLAGCGSEPKPSATATLVNNKQVHDAVSELISAVDGLESNISAFDSENWRDVVPEVKTAASNVVSAVGTLRQALGYSDAG